MKHFFKTKHIFCLLFSFIFITSLFTVTTDAKKEETVGLTGYWQFVNSIQDIPCCGHVLLSYAKDSKQTFYGSLQAQEAQNVSDAINDIALQVKDDTKDSFMLVQDGEKFYIRLSDNTYLRITGDLTSAALDTTEKIEEATGFTIEMTGYGTNNFAYYHIYIPYGTSDISLVISDGNIGLSTACFSGFYMMAEATAAKEPPFGNLTKLVRFLVLVIVIILIAIMLYFYRKDVLNLITFSTASVCIIALLVFFMIFAITTEKPGLYVLHESTFKATALTSPEARTQHNSIYEILEDGSAIFSFEGEPDKTFIWQAQINDENVFTTTSSGNYTNGLYTIWLRPFAEGAYDVVFYYYDATKDISSATECKTYHIEIDANNKITLIEQHIGEV